jgi:hypothetical protein
MSPYPKASQKTYTYRRISVGATVFALIFTLCLPAGRILEPRVSKTDAWTKAEVKHITKLIWNKTDREWRCLDLLNIQESQWDWKSRNPRSGAYGIAQALPPSKYNVISKDWRHNPITQVIWQKKYIEERYSGKPCYAWHHEQKRGWY